MLDFVCPRCGRPYHSEEVHIGKQIRSTNPECGFLVPILAMTDRSMVRPHHSPGNGSAANRRVGKHKGIYGVTVASVVAVMACVLLLRHFNGPKQDRSTLSPTGSTPNPVETATPTPKSLSEDATTITPPPGFLPETPRSAQPRRRARPRPKEYYSLPTGTRIAPDIGDRGYGSLIAQNGLDEDAVVRLSDALTNETIRWFFVQAGTSAQVGSIPQGSYKVTYTTGLNWIDSENTFSWHPNYHEFLGTFKFTEQQDSRGILSHKEFITLNPVPFGNARTRTIRREEFLKGHHHVSLQK